MNLLVNEFGDIFFGKKILVTGASGFIGSHLCDALVSLGAKVYGLDRISPEKKYISQHQISQVDLTDTQLVKTTISEIAPDIIYHLAAMVTARQEADLILPMLENNLIGTVNLLLAAKDAICHRVIIIGSAEEANNSFPTSPYAASKSAAKMYANMFSEIYGLPTINIRLFMTYGPRQKEDKLIPYTIHSLLKNKTPHLNSPERIVDFIYISDIIRGLLMAGFRSNLEGKELELGTGTGIQITDVIELIAKIMKQSIDSIGKTQLNRLNEKHLVNRSTNTRDLLGWEPRWTLEDGLTETINWYCTHTERNFEI